MKNIFMYEGIIYYNICLYFTFMLKTGFSIKKQISPYRNIFRKFLNQEI